ncbi:MAG: hypothetical protein KGZ71_07955, partial [Desulfobulbaceae bacterium]|nr:hypothetical protein [Desulfobulbaceae bacterium]
YNVFGNSMSPKITYKFKNGVWKKHFKVYDYLGSLRFTLGEDKALLNYKQYEPYGETMLDLFGLTRQSYIGKEKETENNLGDHGVRKYDYETGRFNSIDPLFEKYYGWSPYQYSMNNPIWAKDFDGMKLAFSGSNSAINKSYSVINEGTGGFFDAVTNTDGNTILVSTDKQGPQTFSQQEFTSEMMVAIDLSRPLININLSESNNTLIGNYTSQEIDIDDVLNLGNGIGINSFSAFIHEIAEQREKQYNNLPNTVLGYKQAHMIGVNAEDRVSGAQRISIFDKAPSTTYLNSTGSGNLDLQYKILGIGAGTSRISTISIQINANNVTGVTR